MIQIYEWLQIERWSEKQKKKTKHFCSLFSSQLVFMMVVVMVVVVMVVVVMVVVMMVVVLPVPRINKSWSHIY